MPLLADEDDLAQLQRENDEKAARVLRDLGAEAGNLRRFQGLDTAARCGDHAAAIRASGRVWIGRYLTRGIDWRTLLPDEAKAHSAAGLHILSLGQNRNNAPAYFTKENGEKDAAAFIGHAERLEQPPGSAIWYASDTDQIPSTLDELALYFDAVATAMARTPWAVGIYGDPDACIAMTDAGLVRFTMLANAPGWRTKEHRAWAGWDVCQYAEVKPPASGFPFAIDPGEAKSFAGMWRYSAAGEGVA